MVEGSPDLSDEKDFKETEQGKRYYIKKDKSEKPGIELTGYSLVFFKAVEEVLEVRKQEFLNRLLPNFLKSCKSILKYCPGMSAFKGSWQKPRRKSGAFLSIHAAEQFVGEDFFDGMISLFDEKLERENLTVAQTEQVLGTFFISSLVKLYGEVMLQGLFHEKLRALAEKLSVNPLTIDSTGIEQGITYISEIFKPNVATAELVVNAQEQFESIFQNLASQEDNQKFIDLVTLFFLKPFPFEVITNARFIQLETESQAYRIEPFAERLEQRISNLEKMGIISSRAQAREEPEQPLVEEPNVPVNERKRQAEERALVAKHAGHVKTAFDAVDVALRIVRDATGFEVLIEDKIFHEFEEVIQIKAVDKHVLNSSIINAEAVKKLNPIFHSYFVAVHARKFQKNDFCDVFEVSSVLAKVQQIIQNTRQTLQSEAIKATLETAHSLKDMVLPPPAISLRTQFQAAKKNKAGDTPIDVSTLEVVRDKSKIEYKIHRAEFLQGRRHLIFCYTRDRETLSALLNANPLVKALLLSQVLIAVLLKVLSVDNSFKDVSTVMSLEPGLALIGFACGVYALRNPQRLIAPVRILEALSASSVVLTKSLGIAILAHTELFPEEGRPGGIDIERFLTVVASVPIVLALLSWVYNSINPHFKERHFPKRVRFISELINHFAIYSGLIQIISIAIVKIMNRIEKVDFSTPSSRISFELVPLILAPFFAYARVAPIRLCCRRGDAYVNISETINTAVLYGFTTVLLANLAIDLSLADNLPEAQTNFRRVFFPGLVIASTIVIARSAESFPVLYDGNPEVIIQQVIKDRGLQSRSDGTFSLGGSSRPLLTDLSVGAEMNDDENNPLNLQYDEAEAWRKDLDVSGESPKGIAILPMRTMHANKHQGNDEYTRQRTTNNEGKQVRFGSCAML